MVLIGIGSYQLIKLLLVTMTITTAARFYEDTYERQGSLMGHHHNLSPASAYGVERNNQLIVS